MTLLITKLTPSTPLLMLLICIILSVSAWSPNRNFSRFFLINHSTSVQFSDVAEDNASISSISSNELKPFASPNTTTDVEKTRRRFLSVAVMNVCLIGTTVPAFADESSTVTKYISGKTPQVPGETKKKSDDKKGTRKDPSFLRSISDCKTQCQLIPGSDGYSRSKEDCLSECQDISCTTYEQCTFNIVPRL